MIPEYLEVLSYYHPGIGASNSGDGYNYNDIVWEIPAQAIPKATLDTETIALTKLYKKKELADYVINVIENNGVTYQSNQYDISLHKRVTYNHLATVLTANGSILGFTGVLNLLYGLVNMNYSQFINFNQAIANYTVAMFNWQNTKNIAIDALTTAAAVDAYSLTSGQPSNSL